MFSNEVFGPRGGSVRSWKGADAGLRRGTAVDSQITRLVRRGVCGPGPGQFKLTKAIFSALQIEGLVPLMSQLAVADKRAGIATAMDLLCYDESTLALAVVELKCGFSGNVKIPASTGGGTGCRMQHPLKSVPDTILNRHFAQLACTFHMFSSDATASGVVEEHGFGKLNRAVLIYADELGSGPRARVYELPLWWRRKGSTILKNIG